MNTIDDIFAAARALPASERARLITMLWDNLASQDWRQPSQDWIDEANRRSDALDSGKMAVDSWENVRKRARRQAELDG